MGWFAFAAVAILGAHATDSGCSSLDALSLLQVKSKVAEHRSAAPREKEEAASKEMSSGNASWPFGGPVAKWEIAKKIADGSAGYHVAAAQNAASRAAMANNAVTQAEAMNRARWAGAFQRRAGMMRGIYGNPAAGAAVVQNDLAHHAFNQKQFWADQQSKRQQNWQYAANEVANKLAVAQAYTASKAAAIADPCAEMCAPANCSDPLTDATKPECAACLSCHFESLPFMAKEAAREACKVNCTTGFCESPADASKPECAECVACHVHELVTLAPPTLLQTGSSTDFDEATSKEDEEPAAPAATQTAAKEVISSGGGATAEDRQYIKKWGVDAWCAWIGEEMCAIKHQADVADGHNFYNIKAGVDKDAWDVWRGDYVNEANIWRSQAEQLSHDAAAQAGSAELDHTEAWKTALRDREAGWR